jgi:hypothetical protein
MYTRSVEILSSNYLGLAGPIIIGINYRNDKGKTLAAKPGVARMKYLLAGCNKLESWTR